ncbi:hypothetical protein Q3V94_09460 [Caloramator sp. CAR-1]|uniref:hypothetical protein n=1 Tax=Caloramator sp. CAR-1 TaxID=3062777 RepID=UPI0026E26940|nr:hypothetical protein [Caloramator sp. CAR-1]MDO6355286.1 hypothetical protein [Caloramator sp. CAR-1]
MAIKVIKANIRVKGVNYKPNDIIEAGLLSKDEEARLVFEGYAQYVDDIGQNKIEEKGTVSTQNNSINIDFNPDEVIKPKKGRK